MRFLLDTNACIGWLNGTSDAIVRRMKAFPDEAVVVCSVVRVSSYLALMAATGEKRPGQEWKHPDYVLHKLADDPDACPNRAIVVSLS